jgi:hypothetical protein
MEDGDGDVDMDNSDEGEDGAEGWMDVDEEDESSPQKKVNSGGVINNRGPKSIDNWPGSGTKGQEVFSRVIFRKLANLGTFFSTFVEQYKKAINLGQRLRNMHAAR